MKRYSDVFISVLGAVLLWLSWPDSSFTFLAFIAWVPLLMVEDRAGNWKRFFGLSYIHMLVWNVATTWWVWNASAVGAVGAFVANSLIMCVPWLLFYLTKKKFGRGVGYVSLIAYWLCFEFIHHNWELSWPWLTLGNTFASHPEWVQWYEYTGSSGGTLWILMVNIVAYCSFSAYQRHGRTRPYFTNMAAWVALVVIPIVISRLVLNTEQRTVTASMVDAKKNVVVVQPNVDPYTEKFSGSIESQIQKLVTLSEKQIDDNTSLVVWPETAIPAQVWEDQIRENGYYSMVWSFLNRHPFTTLLTGIDSYKNYGTDKHNAPATARFDTGSGTYYDAFNTAAFFEADTSIQLYHKAKLVPGVETLPSFLNFMGSWFENFGGISGTLGRDSERKVFTGWDNYYKSAPVICYESIYSDYITAYVRKGANLLTVITNDGWWGNTPGYRQHMNYARLRAVETRKWVARSANTGISCFIDPLGNVINPQSWDTEASIKLSIPVDNRQTFFVQYGDLLSRFATAISILLLLLVTVAFIANHFFAKKIPFLQN